ncbi:MAG TPA: SufD family Fe-S cluster assembly protein [Bacilli bacterium]
MMNIDFRDIIGPNDEYLVIKDGVIADHSSKVSGFWIQNDVDLKVIYTFTRDSEVDFQISEGVNLNITELFLDIAPDVDITVNYSLKAGAKVNLLSVKNSKQNGKIRLNANIYLENHAYIKLNELSSLPGACELNNRLFLNETDAKAEMKTVTLNSSGKDQIFSVHIFHNSEATISQLNSYGIAANTSKLKINTDGIIKKGSAKAELRQSTKGLILDQKSHVGASPVLEINDFDVVAQHGASIGAIDEDALYYLMSRGISRSDAEKLVVSGFINPFLSAIPEGNLKDWIMSLINLNM